MKKTRKNFFFFLLVNNNAQKQLKNMCIFINLLYDLMCTMCIKICIIIVIFVISFWILGRIKNVCDRGPPVGKHWPRKSLHSKKKPVWCAVTDWFDWSISIDRHHFIISYYLVSKNMSTDRKAYLPTPSAGHTKFPFIRCGKSLVCVSCTI